VSEPTPAVPPRFEPGDPIQHELENGELEYGRVIESFWNPAIPGWDCHVAIFQGQPDVPPVVLRYCETSLAPARGPGGRGLLAALEEFVYRWDLWASDEGYAPGSRARAAPGWNGELWNAVLSARANLAEYRARAPRLCPGASSTRPAGPQPKAAP
jgi:hypothetical protein